MQTPTLTPPVVLALARIHSIYISDLGHIINKTYKHAATIVSDEALVDEVIFKKSM